MVDLMEEGKEFSAGEFADPNAGALIESLRAFGYDTKTAIADLMDNSITAGAKKIWINFFWDGETSYISILDDGNGMTYEELINAMRAGSSSPLEIRDNTDLGRFGLGMKTASFSQCRRLTVATKHSQSVMVARCWDLDHVSKVNKWQLLKIEHPEKRRKFSDLKDLTSGTLILWEKMDRITGGTNAEDIKDLKHFHALIDETSNHLSMTFHRFLEGKNKLKISVNDNKIEPWDPFLRKEPATQDLTDEILKIFGDKINVNPFVLPHHSKINKEQHERAAGPEGWNAHQGFYLYRNKRLIVPGSWLNLGFKKEEHFKLARILVDIPNTMDKEWEIDVKKSVARPPPGLEDELKKIAKITRNRAAEIYRHRGKNAAHSSSGDTLIWQKKIKHGKIFYRINPEHVLVRDLNNLHGETASRVRTLLRLVEETVPVSLIIIDHAENPDITYVPFSESPHQEIKDHILLIYSALLESGLKENEAKGKLNMMEAFRQYPELIELVTEQFQESETGEDT